MLTGLQLEDWKSFGAGRPSKARNELRLSPLTLLVGPNASGKSNALDALRFLQGAALGFPLVDVLRGREGERQAWPAIRGAIVEAPHVGKDGFALRTTWDLRGTAVTHRVVVACGDDVTVREEKLRRGAQNLYDATSETPRGSRSRGDGAAMRVVLRGSGAVQGRTTTSPRDRLLLAQLRPRARVAPEVALVAGAVRDRLRDILFLDLRPSLMRGYRPMNGGRLGISGENLSPVLHSLAEAGRLADVVGWLGELSSSEVEGIAFDSTQLREVMMMLVEAGGRRISARSASDGTLRFLGEVVALLTAEPGAIIVLEEPDVGLHPARIRLLAELLQHVTSERDVQVLATTHSPTLLAHLSPKSLGNVVAFGRDPETGDSVCSRLKDLPHFATLRDSPNIERLISTGWVERAL